MNAAFAASVSQGALLTRPQRAVCAKRPRVSVCAGVRAPLRAAADGGEKGGVEGVVEDVVEGVVGEAVGRVGGVVNGVGDVVDGVVDGYVDAVVDGAVEGGGVAAERPDIAADVTKTLLWVAVATVCAGGIGVTMGGQRALEFVTAYIVEYSLSVDNLFVFLLIFRFFAVERAGQIRVLNWGIAGAMLMRGAMIVAGEELTHHFTFATLGFAALLLYSGITLLFENGDEEEDMENNRIVKFSRSLFPFSDKYDGDRFFTIAKDGARLATPLMLVVLCIEFSDVIFALDSVPAVLGISDDTLVIYASNILAIMGLRNLFFVLSDAIGDLRFLRQALAIVLSFVGGKMIAGVLGHEIGIIMSLSVVVGTLAAGVGLSVAFPETKEEQDEVAKE